VRVSADLFTVLAESQRIARATDGAFDVTQAPVIRLWRQARKDQRLPEPAAIAEAQRRTGYARLVLDPGARTVFLKMRGMLLDVGGIAKGYTADETLKVLRGHGIRRALVAASGDLAIGDSPPQTQGWRVGIFRHVFLLHNIAVSTAGDAEQFLETSGVRYSHIIDPKTGMGLTNRVAVTVLARKESKPTDWILRSACSARIAVSISSSGTRESALLSTRRKGNGYTPVSKY